MRRHFSEKEIAVKEQEALDQEAIVEGILQDPNATKNAICAGLAAGGLAAGGVELLSAGQIQAKMNEAAHILEKNVELFPSIKRVVARDLASVGAILAGGIASIPAAIGAGYGTALAGANALATTGSTGLLEAVPSMISGTMLAGEAAGETALSPWFNKIGNAQKKALNILKATKHFSRSNYRFNFAEDGTVEAPANSSEKVVGEIAAADEVTGGDSTKTAILAGLASVGVGTAAAGTLTLAETKRRLAAVTQALETGANRGFWSRFGHGLVSMLAFPFNEAGHQIANRNIAKVARGTAPISTLSDPVHKVAKFFV